MTTLGTDLIYHHTRIKVLHLLRQPAYVVGTLVLPSLFFFFFAAPNATTPETAGLLLGSFAAFAVLGVVFFQFGLDFAAERESTWFSFMKTLPLGSCQFFIARSLTALLFGLLAAAVVITLVALTTPVALTVFKLSHLFFVLIVGSIPFCLMGLAIGYFTSASSAVPVTNLVYLVLSFAGGLWIPPAGLSPVIQKISPYLPTRFYAEWAWSAMSGQTVAISQILGLGAYALLMLPVIWLGHRRNAE